MIAGPPLRRKRTGTLVRQSQARRWNRTGPSFPPKQAAEGGPQRKAQRSGFALERRSDGVSELCPAGRSEGYEIRDDEVARQEFRPTTQILRAGSSAPFLRHASPVMGVQGDGEYERGALILSHPPGGSLVTFWPARKSLAVRRRRNPPEPISKGEDPLWQ